MRIEEYIIIDCGLVYVKHSDSSCISYVEINIDCIYSNAAWRIKVPRNRLREFIVLFPEIEWEKGHYLHELIGRYIRVTTDDSSKIVSISHIKNDIHYFINKKCD